MSDELDWEMGEMFDSGLFPFPVYEPNVARRVVRYLMKRGVSDEEIASAIQGSTVDLHAWLNRRGRPMFGEWAIAWLNESRDTHRNPLPRRPVVVHRNGSLNDSDSFSRDSSPSDDDDSDSDSDYFRSKQEPEEDGASSSSNFSRFTGSATDFRCSDRDFTSGCKRRLLYDDVMTSESFMSVRSYDVTLKSGLRHVIQENLRDSGNISDLSSAKSKSSFRKDFDSKAINRVHDDVTTTTTRDAVNCDHYKAENASDVHNGLCKCKLSHYIRCHNDVIS